MQADQALFANLLEFQLAKSASSACNHIKACLVTVLPETCCFAKLMTCNEVARGHLLLLVV